LQKWAVLISCKVTNSILKSLEKQGYDLSTFLQGIEEPEEFLRDSSCWLEATKMEDLIKELDANFRDLPEGFVREVGRQCESLRAWGVLDSVLKMVESPLDIYGQPNRFISYFISPEPPIAHWRNEGDTISFQLPVLAQQYPHVTEYLCGALEGLPSYMRQPMSKVVWQDSRLLIHWRQSQGNLLGDEELQTRQFNPQWVRSMMESLEQQQRQLEFRQANETMPTPVLSAEFKNLQSSLKEAHQGLEQMLADILTTKDDFLKLHDYFARSQQLITFLIHSGRKTKQVDEAMRRMDWAHVQSSYDSMVESACERILATKERAQELVGKFEQYTEAPAKEVEADAPSQDLQLPIH
jgi:hypothetical protein